MDILGTVGVVDSDGEGRDARRSKDVGREGEEVKGIIKALAGALRSCGDDTRAEAAVGGAFAVLVSNGYAGYATLGKAGGLDTDEARKLESGAAIGKSQLQVYRLDVVRHNRVGEGDARRNNLNHLLQDSLADRSKGSGIGQGLHGLVVIGVENLEVGIFGNPDGWADNKRILGLSGEILSHDLVIEDGVGAVETHLAAESSSGGDDIRELSVVDATKSVTTGGDLDHFRSAEAHALKLLLKGVDRVLGLGNACRTLAGGIDTAYADWHSRAAARADRCVDAQGDEVSQAGLGRDIGSHKLECRLVARAGVFAIVQLVLERAVQTTNAEVDVGSGHVVEADPEPLGGVLPAGPRSFVGAWVHGVGEFTGAERLKLGHDFLNLVDCVGPCGISQG